MWFSNSSESTYCLPQVTPVLLPDTATADAEWMRASLQSQLEHVNFSKAEAQHFWQHMHFATTSVAETGHWVQGLLAEWTSPRKVITVSTQPGRPVLSGPFATSALVVIIIHEDVARMLVVTS